MSNFWTRIAVVACVTAVVVLGYARVKANSRLHAIYEVQTVKLPIAETPAAATRGRHLANVYGCMDCHGHDLGGKGLVSNPLLQINGSNLTRGDGSATRDYTDEDWTRALLHGVTPAGRAILLMPSHHFRALSDTDAADIITYCKQVPPVSRGSSASTLHLGGLLLLGFGADLLAAEHIDHLHPRAPVVAPPAGVSQEYGRYLTGTCAACHGKELTGGPPMGPPGSVPPPDISASAMRGWTWKQFERAMRKGLKRDGVAMGPMMPWKALGQMTDDELQALWLALHSE